MSTLNTTNIKNPSSASNNIVLDASGNVTISAQGDLRLADSDSSNWVALQAPATVSSNVTWTLPAADGTSGQVLSTDGSGALSWASASGGTSITQGNTSAAVVDTGSDGRFVVTTEGSERLRVDPSGRLLVGTSSAITAPDAAGDNRAASLQLAGNLLATTMQGNHFFEANATGPVYQFTKSNTSTIGNHAVVASGDRLGTLQWSGSDGTNYIRAAQIRAEVDGTPGANDMPGRLVFSTTADGASSPTERMRITSNGDMFFNTTVSGGEGGITLTDGSAGARQLFWKRASTTSTSYPLSFNNGSTNVGFVSFTNTATSYVTSSDYRLKENVTAVTDGITRLQQLKPSRFNFIADPAKMVDGFLAHEVQAVVPEAITGEKDAVDEDGNPVYQGIDQSKLVPLLTAALQEAIGRIETLEAEVAAFKAQ